MKYKTFSYNTISAEEYTNPQEQAKEWIDATNVDVVSICERSTTRATATGGDDDKNVSATRSLTVTVWYKQK